MARSYKELQAKMDPASRADNERRVREELRRMALEELRDARQLTQADMAEMLDVPQSSISRIEQRADMYLSTLRNYIHAVGGELRIQAVFPDGGTVVIDRFGEYEERPYVVDAMAESGGVFRLRARPLHHQGGVVFLAVAVAGVLALIWAVNWIERRRSYQPGRKISSMVVGAGGQTI